MQSVKQTCVAFLIATLLAPGLFLGITPPKQAEAQVANIIGDIVGAGVSYALCEYGEDIREFLGGMLGGVLGGIFGGGNEDPESDDSSGYSVPVNESNRQVKQNLGKTRTTVESDLYKECVLDPVAWVLKALLINIVEQDILDWIDTGFEGGPVFLRDPLAFAKALARDAFDEYMVESGVDDYLCEPFRTSIMQTVYTRSTQSTYGNFGSARCTVDAVFDVIAEQGSVENDGIVGAMRLVEEGNNPYSTLYNLQADAAQRTGEIVAREMTLASYGDGYHSDRCEYNGEWGVCTPGQLISKQVDDWLGGSLSQMENADEAAEVVSELVANLVLHIFGDSEDGLLGGAELDDDAANGILYGTGYGSAPYSVCDEIDISEASFRDGYNLNNIPITASMNFTFGGSPSVNYGIGYYGDPWPPYTASWDPHDYYSGGSRGTGVRLGVCWNDTVEGNVQCGTWDYGILDSSSDTETKSLRLVAGESYGFYMIKADPAGPDGAGQPERTNVQWVQWPASHHTSDCDWATNSMCGAIHQIGDLEEVDCTADVAEDDPTFDWSQVISWGSGGSPIHPMGPHLESYRVATEITSFSKSGGRGHFSFSNPVRWPGSMHPGEINSSVVACWPISGGFHCGSFEWTYVPEFGASPPYVSSPSMSAEWQHDPPIYAFFVGIPQSELRERSNVYRIY